MNRLAVALLVVLAASVLCLEASASKNPFSLLQNYGQHVNNQLQKFHKTYSTIHHQALRQAHRDVKAHFKTLEDPPIFNGTLPPSSNGSDDGNFSFPTNLSSSCVQVFATFVLENLEAFSQCASLYGNIFSLNSTQAASDLAEYCDENSASSCYNLFDHFLNELYDECTTQDLDGMEIGEMDFSSFQAFRLPCFKDNNNQTCFGSLLDLIHFSEISFNEPASQMEAVLDRLCDPCLEALLFSLAESSDDENRAGFLMLNTLCLADNGTYCLVTLKKYSEIASNFSLSYSERTVKSLELVCSNRCYEMYISGLVSTYESSGGVDEEGNYIDVDELEDHQFDFCERNGNGQLCVVKLFNFFDRNQNASDACPFSDYGSDDSFESLPASDDNGTEGSTGPDSGLNVEESGVPISASGSTDDGLDSRFDLPSGMFGDFDDGFDNDTLPCTDGCKAFVAAFVAEAGCCTGSLMRYLSSSDDFTINPQYLFIEQKCGVAIPDPCVAEGLVQGVLTFQNLNIQFVRAHLDDFKLLVRLDLAFSLSIDKNDIQVTSLEEFNSLSYRLMASGVRVGFSITTSDLTTRDLVSDVLKQKITQGGLALANLNSLPAAARIDPQVPVGVSATSASSVSTSSKPLNPSTKSAASMAGVVGLSTYMLLLLLGLVLFM